MSREEFLKSIIVKAGLVTLKMFGKTGVKYTKKHAADVVTEADLISNKMISSGIKKNFPDDGIISEEEPDYNINAEYVWIIDPLDGTFNYSRGVPLYGVMIGLKKGDEIVMSAIYHPYFNDIYFAKKGKGAFRNGKRIHCSMRKEFRHSFGCDSPVWEARRKPYTDALMKNIGKEIVWIATPGSMAISASYTAIGGRDWMTSWNGGIWDYAASSLLLQEAGCKITNIKGKPWTTDDTTMVAANPVLHKKIIGLTKDL